MLIEADTCETRWQGDSDNLGFFQILLVFLQVVIGPNFDIILIGWKCEIRLKDSLDILFDFLVVLLFLMLSLQMALDVIQS